MLITQGKPESRFGLLSQPFPQTQSQVLIIEASLKGYAGLNALLCLYGGTGRGDYSHALELGVERGRAQVWDWHNNRTGWSVSPPYTLRIIVGLPKPDGRLLEFHCDNQPV